MKQPGNDGKPVRESSLSLEELIRNTIREEQPEDRPYRTAARFCKKTELKGVREAACIRAAADESFSCAAFHPLGEEIAAGILRGGAALLARFDASLKPLKREILSFPGEGAPSGGGIRSIVYPETGDLAACETADSVYLLENGQTACIHFPPETENRAFRRMVFADGETLAICRNPEKEFRFWNFRNGKTTAGPFRGKRPEPVTDILATLKNELLAVRSGGHTEQYSSVSDKGTLVSRSLREVYPSEEAEDPYRLFAAGGSFYTAGRNVLTRLYAEETPVPLCAPAGSVLAFSPDGSALAAADGEAVRFLSPADGRVLREFPVQEGPVLGLAFSPEGCLLCVCQEKQLRLLRLDWELSFPGWQDLNYIAENRCREFCERNGAVSAAAVCVERKLRHQNDAEGPFRPEDLAGQANQCLAGFLKQQKERLEILDLVRDHRKRPENSSAFYQPENARKTLLKYAASSLLGILLCLAGAAGIVFCYIRIAREWSWLIAALIIPACFLLSLGFVFIRDNIKKIRSD